MKICHKYTKFFSFGKFTPINLPKPLKKIVFWQICIPKLAKTLLLCEFFSDYFNIAFAFSTAACNPAAFLPPAVA